MLSKRGILIAILFGVLIALFCYFLFLSTSNTGAAGNAIHSGIVSFTKVR